MSPAPIPSVDSAESRSDRFFSRAIPRMLRVVIILGVGATLAVAWRFGLISSIGFAAGAAIAYLSFRSLNKAVESLAGRIAESGQPSGGFSLVNGFFLRYLLAGVVAYVIFTSSPKAFRGFLCSGHAGGSGLRRLRCLAPRILAGGCKRWACGTDSLHRKILIGSYGATLVHGSA